MKAKDPGAEDMAAGTVHHSALGNRTAWQVRLVVRYM
jgi:hypothetical protein